MPKFVSPDVTEVYDVMLTYAGTKQYGDVFSCKAIEDMAEDFVLYYESVGWVVGKNKMKSWPHAAMRWVRTSYQRKNNYTTPQKSEQTQPEKRSSGELTPREQILRRQNDEQTT
jgi:hypothetical protein